MQADATPYFFPRRRSSSSSVSSQPRAARAERMTERDRAAVDVDLVAIEAELLLDGEYCAANASLISMRSRSPSVSSGALERLADRRRRPHAHDRRLDADRRPRHDAGRAASAPRAFAASLAGDAPARRAPSTMPLALPAVTTPSFLKTPSAASPASPSSCRAACDRPCSTSVTPFRVLISTGIDFVLATRPDVHAWCASCWLRSAYASCSSRVMPYFAAQFSAVCAMSSPQYGSSSAFPQPVFELALAQPKAAAQPANHVRRLAHALHAAGQHESGLVELNVLRAADDGLNAGAAQPIDRQRRHFDRHAGLQRHVARAVDAHRAASAARCRTTT